VLTLPRLLVVQFPLGPKAIQVLFAEPPELDVHSLLLFDRKNRFSQVQHRQALALFP
jgi:hypothetical protein